MISLSALLNRFLLRYSFLDQRMLNLRKNIAASVLIKICNIAIGLILVPVTINYLDSIKYGVWITISSLFIWFSFFDAGLGNGLRNKLAEASAKGKYKLGKIYVSTAYAMLTIVITVLALIFFLINQLLDWSRILNAPPELTMELNKLAMFIFVFVSVQLVLNLLNMIFLADQKSALPSFLNLVSNSVILIMVILLSQSTNGSLIYLGVIISGVPVIILICASLWFFNSNYTSFKPSLKYVRFRLVHGLMGLGIKFFVLQIAVIVLYQTSYLLISHLFGPGEVTPYNIAFRYFSVIPMVFSIVITPFWSAFTEAFTKKEYEWIIDRIKLLKRIWYVLTLASIGMFIISGWVYPLWVGDKVHISAVLSFLNMIYVCIVTWNSIYLFFLNGAGKIQLQLYLSIIIIIINIPLAFLIEDVFSLGTPSVIISIACCQFLFSIFAPVQYKKIINKNAHGIWNA